MTSRYRSASICAESRVEPTRSTKTTVTILRSSGSGDPTGNPQFGQNFAWSGSGSPQRMQVGRFIRPSIRGAVTALRPALLCLRLGQDEPQDVQDRAGPLLGRANDDRHPLPDLQGLVAGVKDVVQEDRVGPVEANEPQRHRAVEGLAVQAGESDRERDEGASGADLDTGVELGETPLAEQPGRHVRVGAPLAARSEERAAVAERREERLTGHAGRVSMRDGEVARPPADLVGPGHLLPHQSCLLGRKWAMSRIEPTRSPTGFHTASTSIPMRTASGSTSPSMWRNPPSEPSMEITAGISGGSSGCMSKDT